jgi:hypothetical protein
LTILSGQQLSGYVRVDVSLCLREAITFPTSGKMFWPFVKVWQGYRLRIMECGLRIEKWKVSGVPPEADQV